MKDIYLLVRTEGYDIQHWKFNTYEEALNELSKQYKELTPDDWMENEEEMSFFYEYDAMLYQNGLEVYVWKIIKI